MVLLRVPAAHADTSDRIRLLGVTYLGDLPTYIADERGLFARHGLSVAVEHTSSGKRNLAALRAGEADFALMALTPLVLDRLAADMPAGPEDPVILGSIVHSTHLNHVVTLAENGIGEPADLAGRRIGLMRGTNAEYMWWLFSAYHRLEPDEAEIVDLPIDALPDALVEGRIDAAVLWEPWIARLEERLGGGLRKLEGSRVYSAKWILVTTRRNARDRSDRCRAVLAAYREAIDFIERHPREALRIHAELTGVGVDQLRRHGDDALYGLGLDWSLIAGLQQQIDWASRTGYPVARSETDLLSWIEAAPLRAVAPSAVGIPAPAGEVERQ